jgi:hypothetical protein
MFIQIPPKTKWIAEADRQNKHKHRYLGKQMHYCEKFLFYDLHHPRKRSHPE